MAHPRADLPAFPAGHRRPAAGQARLPRQGAPVPRRGAAGRAGGRRAPRPGAPHPGRAVRHRRGRRAATPRSSRRPAPPGARVHRAADEVHRRHLARPSPRRASSASAGSSTRPSRRSSPPGPQLVAVLAHVRDPGNAGTVLRCADAAGADAVVLTDASVDLYNPKSVRASVGSPLPPARRRRRARRARPSTGCAAPACGSSPPTARATTTSTPSWTRAPWAGPPPGSSATRPGGCPEETRALADAVVRVPIHGKAESLNLATAAAVCLYASARAQRASGGCRSVTAS